MLPFQVIKLMQPCTKSLPLRPLNLGPQIVNPFKIKWRGTLVAFLAIPYFGKASEVPTLHSSAAGLIILTR